MSKQERHLGFLTVDKEDITFCAGYMHSKDNKIIKATEKTTDRIIEGLGDKLVIFFDKETGEVKKVHVPDSYVTRSFKW